MANRERGELTIALAGRPHVLRITVGACCELEDRAGLSWDALASQLGKGSTIAVRWLLWAALQGYHAADYRTIEAAGRAIDAVGGVRKSQKILLDLIRLNAAEIPPATRKGKPTQAAEGSLWRVAYLECRVIGLTPEAFWRLSLKELWRELAVARLSVERARERDLFLAWHCAALVWQKKLPSLESLLGGSKSSRRQSPAEIRMALEMISGMTGIPLRKGKARV